MPTLRTVTVKPSGGDYASLNAAVVGEAANLVTLDRQLDIACYSMLDSAVCNITGFTTDATHFVRAYTPSSERHNGRRSPTKYRLIGNNGFNGMLVISVSNVRVEGFQICNTSTAPAAGLLIWTPKTTAEDVRLSDTLIYDIAANSGAVLGAGIQIHLCETFHMVNCVVMNCHNAVGSTGAGIVCGTGAATTAYLYNCVFVNCDIGVRGNSITSKNCYVGGNAGGDFTSYTGTKTTCHASDASGNTQTAWSTSSGGKFTNVTPGSEDVTISATSALLDVATDLSADVEWKEPGGSVDIIGTTRPQGSAWDIGAFERIASVPPSNTAIPRIFGTASLDSTLSEDDGAWLYAPTSYSRQWYRGGIAIGSATGATYRLQAADVGQTLTVGVIAHNAYGDSSEVLSSAIGPVVAQIPAPTKGAFTRALRFMPGSQWLRPG